MRTGGLRIKGYVEHLVKLRESRCLVGNREPRDTETRTFGQIPSRESYVRRIWEHEAVYEDMRITWSSKRQRGDGEEASWRSNEDFWPTAPLMAAQAQYCRQRQNIETFLLEHSLNFHSAPGLPWWTQNISQQNWNIHWSSIYHIKYIFCEHRTLPANWLRGKFFWFVEFTIYSAVKMDWVSHCSSNQGVLLNPHRPV